MTKIKYYAKLFKNEKFRELEKIHKLKDYAEIYRSNGFNAMFAIYKNDLDNLVEQAQAGLMTQESFWDRCNLIFMKLSETADFKDIDFSKNEEEMLINAYNAAVTSQYLSVKEENTILADFISKIQNTIDKITEEYANGIISAQTMNGKLQNLYDRLELIAQGQDNLEIMGEKLKDNVKKVLRERWYPELMVSMMMDINLRKISFSRNNDIDTFV